MDYWVENQRVVSLMVSFEVSFFDAYTSKQYLEEYKLREFPRIRESEFLVNRTLKYQIEQKEHNNRGLNLPLSV